MAKQYTLVDICDKLKVSKSTIRFHEIKFPEFLSAKRFIGKKRVFTEEDVRVFAEIQRMQRHDQPLEQIREFLKERFADQSSLEENKELENNIAISFPKPENPPTNHVIEQERNTVERVPNEDIERLSKKIDDCVALQMQIGEAMKRIGTVCKDMKSLLDLNLIRYNELSKELQKHK